MKNFINRFVFFVGWLLSPFTFWNDAFVNIPLSYICASLFVRLSRSNFLLTTLLFYWLSNILGIFMMYLSGKSILKDRKSIVREVVVFLITIAAYSLILIVLHRLGALKPL